MRRRARRRAGRRSGKGYEQLGTGRTKSRGCSRQGGREAGKQGGEHPGGGKSVGVGGTAAPRQGSQGPPEGSGLSGIQTGDGSREGRCDGSQGTHLGQAEDPPRQIRRKEARAAEGGKKRDGQEDAGCGAAVSFTHSPGAFSWAP